MAIFMSPTVTNIYTSFNQLVASSSYYS